VCVLCVCGDSSDVSSECSPVSVGPPAEVVSALKLLARSLEKKNAELSAKARHAADAASAQRRAARARGCPAGRNAAASFSCGKCSSKDVAKLKKLVKRVLKRQGKIRRAIHKKRKLHRARKFGDSCCKAKRKLPIHYRKGFSHLSKRQRRQNRINAALGVAELGKDRHNWAIEQRVLDASDNVIDTAHALHLKARWLRHGNRVEAVAKHGRRRHHHHKRFHVPKRHHHRK